MRPRRLVLPLRDAARNLAGEAAQFRTLAPGHPGLSPGCDARGMREFFVSAAGGDA